MKYTAMRLTDIDRLLNDFYEGRTSLEQEKELLSFFKTDVVPEEFRDEQAMFLSCYQEKDIFIPSNLKNKLEILIDKQVCKEESSNASGQANTIQRAFNPETAPPKPGIKMIDTLWFRFSAVAASIMIIFTISFFAYRNFAPNELTDTYTNPSDAYLQTQRALTLVAHNLNTGFTQLEEAQEDIGKAKQIMDQQLKKISKNDNDYEN